MSRTLVSLLAVFLSLGAAASAWAGDKTYTFGTYDARTNISFTGEADIETIVGFSNKLSGAITLGDAGLSSAASLSIDVKTLDTGIALRDEHLQSESWLDAAKYPAITLALSKVTPTTDKKVYDYEGTLTIKGKAKAIKSQAKLKLVDAATAEKFQLGAGDWVNVKASFEVKLSDFGVIVPDGAGAKVSDKWTIEVDIWGTTSPAK